MIRLRWRKGNTEHVWVVKISSSAVGASKYEIYENGIPWGIYDLKLHDTYFIVMNDHKKVGIVIKDKLGNELESAGEIL